MTVALICDLHRSWLGPLYEFAGTIRKVDLAKDEVRFAPLVYLEGSLRTLDEVLRQHTPCERMSRKRLVPAIAQVHAELILVHPFREGNGRLARLDRRPDRDPSGLSFPRLGFRRRPGRKKKTLLRGSSEWLRHEVQRFGGVGGRGASGRRPLSGRSERSTMISSKAELEITLRAIISLRCSFVRMCRFASISFAISLYSTPRVFQTPPSSSRPSSLHPG